MNSLRNSGAKILALLSIFVLVLINASCPNNCNGQGECDKYSRCHCAEGYQGADCSEMICPFGLAWADQATETDVAHNMAECSNRGLCDRSSGQCECMDGFTGSACERLACPNRCSDRGVCMTMQDFAHKKRDDSSQSFTYDSIWDAKKTQGCVCDFPATGYDCSLTMCPTGDDPLTTGQVNEIQLVKCTANTGAFTLFYEGLPSLTIPYNADAATIRTALLRIPYVNNVKVTFSMPLGTACQMKANIIIIEFTQLFGALAPLVALPDAEMKRNGGFIEINADGVTSWRDAQGRAFRSRKGTKENDVCSNRGVCDYNTGICSCYNTNGDVYGSSDGYGGPGNRGDCGYIVSASTKNVSTCPGLPPCSGHGVCDPESFRCYCQSPFTGGDCSLSTCPSGRSWFSYPTADEEAHMAYTVCSDMGTCDQLTGKCVCREGFYGSACEYMSCPTHREATCGHHGRCMSMYELALHSKFNGDAIAVTYGSDVNNVHTWDGHKIHGCLCDEGYGGYNCGYKYCPGGDDPGTYDDHSEVQIVQCLATGGNFSLTFRTYSTPILPYNIQASELEEELRALPSILDLSVYFILDGLPPDEVLDTSALSITVPTLVNSAFCSDDGHQLAVIHFTHTHGNVPAIQPNNRFLTDGVNSNNELGSGIINVFSDGQAVYGLVTKAGTTETDLCNNRGICDGDAGMCRCFDDWTSSDGARQGGEGYTNDCGYRNDKRFTSFDSIKL